MKKLQNRNYGSWALITGAAGGMGRHYGMKLAGLGYNVILVDRNGEGLEKLAAEIGQNHPSAAVLALDMDLARCEAAKELAQRVAEFKVEVLVNNAGILLSQYISEASDESLSNIVLLHCYTPLLLCHYLVGPMLERGCGYILNVSSFSSWAEWPMIGIYGGSKRFIKAFSRQLRIECRGTGVSVTNAYYGAVDTPMIPLPDNLKRLAYRLGIMISADKATDISLKALFKRKRGAIPGMLYKIALPFCIIMPERLLSRIFRKVKKIATLPAK